MNERIDYKSLACRMLAGGHTTASLAKAIGLSQPAVSRLATGKQATINADSALRLIVLAGGQVQLPAVDDRASSHA